MVEKNLNYNPSTLVHPGESLRDELEYLNISQTDLAQRTGLSEKHISQIINGESPITPESAIKLERVLSSPAAFWNNLQKNYDLADARIRVESRLHIEVDLAKEFVCYSELVKLGFVRSTKNWKEKAESLLNFFGVDSLSYIEKTEAIAFRQAKGKFNQKSLAAWLRCGELDSKKVVVESFDEKKLKSIIPELRRLTLHPKDFGLKAKKLCASAGVALVFTPYFPGTKVNGSSRWIGDKPVIQLNTKGAYSDIFWFTFFHEIGHIIKHGVKEQFLDYDGKNRDEKESEADEFSEEALIPESEYRKLINSKLSLAAVRVLAESVGVGTGIIIGRLAHEGRLSWSKANAFRERIRIGS